MIRALSLFAATLALAAPAVAGEKAANTGDANPAVRAHLTAAAGALEARNHLAAQGYVNISTLELDALGRWSGTAVKDGKTTIVAIKLPRAAASVLSN
jgi:hypothetical protein